MDIKPPFGYREIVPLTRTQRVVLRQDGTLPEAFRETSALPLSFAEFAPAACHYPIAFVSGDNGKSFVAMVVLGIENQRNLFVGADAKWDAASYVPAYVRRHPFCMSRVAVNGAEQAQRIVCVEKSAVAAAGEALFDDKGEPLPAWAQRHKFLVEFETDLARTEEMTRALAEEGLFEPFTMQAVPKAGAPLALTGLYRVSEQKLNELAPEKLKALAQSGRLARVYAHLVSLHNFARLLDRRVARSATPATRTS